MVRSTFHVACFNSSSEISHTLWPLVELLKYAGVGNRFQTPTSKSRKVRFESRKPRPPALRLLILIICYHHITSVCFFCVCVCLFQPKDIRVIRSQFACTYKDEELPLNRVLEFPSTSQVPTCVHPAPKTIPAVDEEECSLDLEEDATTGRGFKSHRCFTYGEQLKESTQALQRSRDRFLFPLTPRGWTTAQAHLLISSLGLVLTISR